MNISSTLLTLRTRPTSLMTTDKACGFSLYSVYYFANTLTQSV